MAHILRMQIICFHHGMVKLLLIWRIFRGSWGWYTLTHSQRIFASLQYAGATARCKHCRHIESANRKWSYNIHGRPIVFNLTRENE